MSDRTISIVINVDTRRGFDRETTVAEVMMQGTRSLDFMLHGVYNKRKFFDGFPIELTLFVDVHDDIPQGVMVVLQQMMVNGIIDNLVLNKHTKRFDGQNPFHKFNDINFLHALMMSRGKYVAHFDGDMSAFCGDNGQCILEWLNALDTKQYRYISYPSSWSPSPDGDTRWDYYWASTRFFMCRRSELDYTEILSCLRDDDYLYGKYGEKYRRCPWLEHILGIIAGPGQVYYPPLDYNRYLIFSWSQYHFGTLRKLNEMSFNEVRDYVYLSGGVQYPCDVKGLQL